MTPEAINALVSASVNASLTAVLWPLLLPGVGAVLAIGGLVYQLRSIAKKVEQTDIDVRAMARVSAVEANRDRLEQQQRQIDARPSGDAIRAMLTESLAPIQRDLSAIKALPGRAQEAISQVETRLLGTTAEIDRRVAKLEEWRHHSDETVVARMARMEGKIDDLSDRLSVITGEHRAWRGKE